MVKSNVERIQPRVLSLKDAAKYLGMGEWKLRRLVWAGKLPFIQLKAGAALQFDVDDLNKFIAANKKKF
jgi:excisionase family DNA binding protein